MPSETIVTAGKQCVAAAAKNNCRAAGMPHEGMEDDHAGPESSAVATEAEVAASTALASLLCNSCTIIDMGSYLLSDVYSRPYTADDAALPCIAGEHVRQILPEALVDRAVTFPPFDPTRQVSLYKCIVPVYLLLYASVCRCTCLLMSPGRLCLPPVPLPAGTARAGRLQAFQH